MSDDDIDWPEHATLPPAPWEPGRFELMDHGVIDLGLDLHFTKGRTTMGDRDDGWLPADEKLSPERAVRLLRARGAELENGVMYADTFRYSAYDAAADIALIAQLLADHIERSERVIERLSILAEITQPPPEVPLATRQRRQSTAKAWYQDASDTFILTQVPMPQPDDAMVIRRCSGKGESYHATWTSHPVPLCGLGYSMDTPVYPETKLTCHYCKRIVGRAEQ